MSGFAPRVKAVLGPTNTGKTHLAMDRMLAHHSGIIGFPLRLLARENYDRMVAARGARHVALITGEEKIVPPEARWFACTVEAMPLDRPAEFVAVDEIQLCADADRGHVFTDRLLHARGLVETMFLGAETIRPLLRRLIPQAEIETRPRLSQLAHAGPTKLLRLPPRSAVVAFSATDVYAIAEAIRRRKGGCVVVMGRLSPRTRNAQVALYQEKEVDFLVATDAIGMGLNMDVDHVAFAGLQKFDGHRPRRLAAPEIAQIAGRAGRGMRDGSFGTTGDCPPLTEDLVEAVEAHRFEPLEQLCWRNAELDFSSIDALLASLTQPPKLPGLTHGRDATDLTTLISLAREPDLRAEATTRARIRLLWEACQIPDFRKISDDSHTSLCLRIFRHILRDGALPTDWIAGQIGAIDNKDGDIDTLMARLSGIRVWSYITARGDWLKHAPHWQAEARRVEDRLSDALHERLLARFVDRRSAHLLRRLEGNPADVLSAVTRRGEVVVEGHSVGHIGGFSFFPDPSSAGEERKLVLRAARRALLTEMPRRVDRLEAEADDAFVLHPGYRIAWQGVPIARLRRGARPLRPQVEVDASEFLDGARRERVRLRLQAWHDAQLARDFAPLLAAEAHAAAHPLLRGPVHRLTEGLGIAAPAPDLPEPAAAALRRLGIEPGRFALFMPCLLKPAAQARRALLWSLAHATPLPELPPVATVALPPEGLSGWPPGFAEAIGYVPCGPALLRLDVAEKIAAELHASLAPSLANGSTALPAGLAPRLSIKAAAMPAVLRSFGIRLRPAAVLPPQQSGPPNPPMMAARQPKPPAPTQRRSDSGPFAKLAALQANGD
jgi:ATP-dependent RNA helicase SUPV3L1/SUV3